MKGLEAMSPLAAFENEVVFEWISIMRRRAFTLIELLVVIAIIAILAAILFPVFAQAKSAAKKTQALTNSKQMGTSVLLYAADYDDLFPVAFFTNSYSVVPPDTDTNTHSATYPYMKNTDIWSDPMDSTSQEQKATIDLIPPASVAAAYQTDQRRLNLGYKSDFGINGQFMHPQEWTGSQTIHHPISQTAIGNVSKTIYSISSVWNRTASGTPTGGGNYEVDAPCIYDASFNDLRPGMQSAASYWWFGGWNPSSPNAWNVYGGVWPWHGSRTIVTYTDSHANTKHITAVAAGCNVLDGHGGTVTNLDTYEWDVTQ
jgi:prepilin-type N-terminal cleavage/methylation domain-containing protein